MDHMGTGLRSHVRRFLRGTIARVLRIVAYGVIGAVLMLITLAVVVLERRADLEQWHSVHLDEEFTEDTGLASFDEYLALEDRLFTQLDEAVYSEVPSDKRTEINRYHHGSL